MSNMIINDMDKNWNRLIVVYGLSEEQVKEVEKSVPVKDCEVYSTECFTDTIALPLMVSIVTWNLISPKDKDFFIEYYTDVTPFAETVVLIGDIGDDIPKELKKNFEIYTSFEEFMAKAKYVLLNAYRKTKKNEGYSEVLANSLLILSEIRRKQYITTRELAERIEKSERTVQRYIRSLTVAGEWIEYDVSHKGWTLLAKGKSILWGDDLDDVD